MKQLTIYEKWVRDGEIGQKLLLAEGYAREGLTQVQIAHNLGISETTFYEYMKDYPDFKKAVSRGKEVVDFAVENALFQNAMGGNVTAQIFWLSNRKRDKWQQRVTQDMHHNDMKVTIVDDLAETDE